MGGLQRQVVDLHTARGDIFCRTGAGGVQHGCQHRVRTQGRHGSLLQGALAAFGQTGGQCVDARSMHGAVPCTGQLRVDKFLLVGEDHRVKCVLTLGVCQQVPHAAALKAKAQNRTEIIPVGRQLIPVSGALQVGQRFFLPGVGRLNTEHPAFCRVKAAPKADAAAPGLVAGGLRQALLPVREKARITRDAAAYRNAAQLLNTAHQAALVVILRRHKAAHRIGGIRRRRHCFPARRAGHP